jgi:lysyl-tRNA synthetase class 2
VTAAEPDAALDLPEQVRVRREKRARVLAAGRDAYAVGFARTTTLRALRDRFQGLAPGTETGEQVGVTGRVIFVRNTGRLCFARLREGDGTELQAMLSLDRVGEQALADWKALVDIGDHVGVAGEVVASKRGELSVAADRWELTSKALRPLPVEHKPLSEETRIRQRYVDLIVRPQARQNARLRIATVRSLRRSLESRDYLEVETPMLQTLPGGAAARPFVTHSNAFDLDLYLRIAPELFLKRCVVGGLDRVFEINRNFRNEGADSTHSPEFAMLEAYQAYADYDVMADLTRDVIQEAAQEVCGGLVVRLADGRERDLSGDWPRLSLCELTSDALGEEVGPQTPYEHLAATADRVGLQRNPAWVHGKLLEELFEHVALPRLDRPAFVRDYPVDTSPLVRDHRSRPGLVEKWDLYVDGVELATGYTELIDPVVQRQRLVEQARLGAAGDAEAMRLDEDFLRAMEHGLPPLGGIGMGIDRLLMALTGLGIRETILFPLVKPE